MLRKIDITCDESPMSSSLTVLIETTLPSAGERIAEVSNGIFLKGSLKK